MNCPHCGQRISFYADKEEIMDPVQRWLLRQPERTQQLVSGLKDCGLVGAFEQAVRQAIEPAPNNMAKFLLTFLRIAGPMKLTPAQRLVIQGEFKGQEIEVLQHAKVSALLLNQKLTLFFPADLLAMNQIDSTNRVVVGELSKAQTQLHEWRKTRMGYVPLNASAFYETLRKRSFGEFEKAG